MRCWPRASVVLARDSVWQRPLIAASIRDDDDHRLCVDLCSALHLNGERLLVPPTVIAEVGYMLERLGSLAHEAAFLRSVAASDFEPIDLTVADYARMSELVEQYDDLPLGTTDASVIAVAERLGVTEIVTLDARHFRIVRPRHTDAFVLLPDSR